MDIAWQVVSTWSCNNNGCYYIASVYYSTCLEVKVSCFEFLHLHRDAEYTTRRGKVYVNNLEYPVNCRSWISAVLKSGLPLFQLHEWVMAGCMELGGACSITARTSWHAKDRYKDIIAINKTHNFDWNLSSTCTYAALIFCMILYTMVKSRLKLGSIKGL